MKKNIIHFAAAGIMAVSAIACSKELGNGTADNQTIATEPIVLQASSQTKTHIQSIAEGKATIYWNVGDAISILSTDKGGNIELTASDIKGNQATFAGDVVAGTTTFAAVYPYTLGASYSSGTITGFSIPTTQTATAGSFANGAALAMAKGEKTASPEVSLTFNNLCSVLAFTFPSNITFANEVTITAKNGGKIAGEVTIDYNTAAITAATATSVVIKPASGNFTAGETYYITVAPGTYTDGVSFTIKTAGGNTYYRATSKTINAAAGGIYPLGKLSLELPAECFSPKVVVTHNVSGGVLNGSTAVFSMTSTVPDEFDSAIKSVLTTVSVAKGEKTYRSCAVTGKKVDSQEMTIGAGCPYVPSGCTYQATIAYTIDNGEKEVARQIIKNCDVVYSAPSGFSITAAPTGYTSYSCYAGTDGQSKSVTNANNCDNATIYGIGYTYTGGLAANVKTQADNEKLLSIATTLDGNAASGNATSQSWAAHTIKVTKWEFDGVSGNINSEKQVHVTGLPYNKNNDKAYNYKDDWSWTKNGSWKDDNYLNWYLATVNFKGFYIPGNINSTISYRFKNYSGSSFTTYLKCWAGGTLFVNAEDKATSKWYEYSGSNSTITFTPSNNSIICENSAKSSSASSWVATSQMFYFGAVYR